MNIVGNCNTVVSIIILYFNIIILWDHRHICGPSLTETSLCGAYLYEPGDSLSLSISSQQLI